ncbi:MAG TPA: 6-carboxytetrahydropterin synthase [Bacteroidales bacterium]|nr:6-carboxytetrahydropterin synthase [Bacteroidales bacterium]HNS46282.1 6-carboxytetrahydropterin synthase [Bacteroidales bacterium]
MSVIRLTKSFAFEMAHALPGHDGPCKHIHGHTYELFVTIIGKPVDDPLSPKFGMIMDFKELKSLVRGAVIDDFDHALVLRKDTADALVKEAGNVLFQRMIVTDFQPTTENLVAEFARRIHQQLPSHVTLQSLRLRETLTSFAEWFAADNP